MNSKKRSNKQKCQFFRWRFKGFVVGQLTIVRGFLNNYNWLSFTERNRLAAIANELSLLSYSFDKRTKTIIKETKNET